jgi:hypothetical protein
VGIQSSTFEGVQAELLELVISNFDESVEERSNLEGGGVVVDRSDLWSVFFMVIGLNNRKEFRSRVLGCTQLKNTTLSGCLCSALRALVRGENSLRMYSDTSRKRPFDLPSSIQTYLFDYNHCWQPMPFPQKLSKTIYSLICSKSRLTRPKGKIWSIELWLLNLSPHFSLQVGQTVQGDLHRHCLSCATLAVGSIKVSFEVILVEYIFTFGAEGQREDCRLSFPFWVVFAEVLKVLMGLSGASFHGRVEGGDCIGCIHLSLFGCFIYDCETGIAESSIFAAIPLLLSRLAGSVSIDEEVVILLA